MFEFDDNNELPIQKSPRPVKNEIYINVVNQRAIVSRYVALRQDEWGWQPCDNWEALEHEALECLNFTTRGLIRETFYSCPLTISQYALWDDRSSETSRSAKHAHVTVKHS